jgi:hypothetical protein
LAFLESVLGPDHIKTVEDEYQQIKDDFQETLCPKCNLTRTMFSWSKLGLPAMAKKAGYGLEHCYYNAYATPTQQAHSTVLAFTSRVKQQPDGRFFDNSVQRVYAGLGEANAGPPAKNRASEDRMKAIGGILASCRVPKWKFVLR